MPPLSDTKVTPEQDKIASDLSLGSCRLTVDERRHRIAQALANAHRDGRREGLEQAAQWFENEAEALEATARRNLTVGTIGWVKDIRLAASRCLGYSKAILALKDKPAEETP